MKKYIYIGARGFLGAIIRFGIKTMSIQNYKGAIPINTLFVNITGSFLLALITVLALEVTKINDNVKLGIGTGFLGAYTTFSTLMYEGFNLFQERSKLNAFTYILGSVILGVISYIIGTKIVVLFFF